MAVFALFCAPVNAASVVQRGTAARPTAVRTNTASRMPTMVTRQTASTETADETTEPDASSEPDTETTVETVDEVLIENKASQFETILGESSVSNTDTASNQLAEMIARQRAALDSQDAANTASLAIQNSLATGQNACDMALRACMQSKCGTNYTKCSGDTDTAWGNKIDSCRRDATCTGEEYRIFASEIKADRDMNAKLANYNAIIDCGNQYNNCIVTQCGPTFTKCLGKSAGDAAISACATIAKNCTGQDNGLANRTMNVFATLRQDAEVQVKKDEQRLYALRDTMAQQCRMLGAMFDERSLDCVYTVNFFAGDASTPYASKKAYAGSVFDCDQNWFGVDITTFKENAYRLTRAQKSATSAMLGSGVGMAAGAVTSGAIGRAIDRQKADNALKKAEQEHAENYGANSEKSDTKTDNSKSEKSDTTDANTNNATTGTPENDAGKTNTEKTDTTTDADAQKTATTTVSATGGTNTSSTNDDSKKKINNRRQRKTSSETTTNNTDTKTTSDKNQQDYNKCVSDTRRKYAFNAEQQPRYTEIYQQMVSDADAQLARYLDTVLTSEYKGDCTATGIGTTQYTCKVGQTRRQCIPTACHNITRPSNLSLEMNAKKQFMDEIIAQNCDQYK